MHFGTGGKPHQFCRQDLHLQCMLDADKIKATELTEIAAFPQKKKKSFPFIAGKLGTNTQSFKNPKKQVDKTEKVKEKQDMKLNKGL